VSEPRVLSADEVRQRATALIVAVFQEQVGRMPDLHPEMAVALKHLLSVLEGGKRFRARYCYEGWRAAGGTGSPDSAITVAASAELSHIFALVQDDVIDRSAMRRGHDTMHRHATARHLKNRWKGAEEHYGNCMALMLGNLCWGWSNLLLERASDDPAKVVALKSVNEQMLIDGTYGEALDVILAAERVYDPEWCQQVTLYKTGLTMFKPPLLMGGILAGADAGLLATYAHFGTAVGNAYQLRDDLLGAFGDPRVTGKSNMEDVRDGKPTILVSDALGRVEQQQRSQILARYGDPDMTVAEADELRQLLNVVGVLAAMGRKIEEYTVQAFSALEDSGLSAESVKALRELTREALHRSR
jgi:geranylgeranyl diphosphate synthase type I